MAVTTFATNENNDIYIGNDGNLAIAVGLPAVINACSNAAKTRLGECIYNTTLGLPDFETIWIGVPNIPQFEAALIQTLLSVPGVSQVQEVAAAIDKGVLSYTAVIITIYGQGVINGSI